VSAIGRLVAATLVGVAGLWLLVTGVAQRRPAMGRLVAYLDRVPVGGGGSAPVSGWLRAGRRLYGKHPFGGDVLADLRLVQRPPGRGRGRRRAGPAPAGVGRHR